MRLFFLGLFLAIPLSIAANLLTPNINRLLLKWSKTRRGNYERRLADEQEEITRILSHPFRFYRYLLRLIYIHVVTLTLFFLLYWILATAPNLLAFAYRITGHGDPKEIARLADVCAQWNAVMAVLFSLTFMLLLTKTYRVVQKLMEQTGKD